jgi:phosphoglycerol transferase MdoB-like AlkP superfamily enzyme
MPRLPIAVRYILAEYIAGILFFTFFRCLFLYTNAHTLQEIPSLWALLPQVLFLGFRFDTVVCGYILILPAVVLLLADLLGINQRRLCLFANVYINILLVLAIFMCAADIPFFKNFGTRLNATALDWSSSPGFVIKMILQDGTLRLYLFLFVLVSIVWVLVSRAIYRRYAVQALEAQTERVPVVSRASAFVLLPGLLVLGIRGRTDEKSPILPGTAYFCNYDILNQAGLDPVFMFLWSWTDQMKPENQKLALMDERASLQHVKRYLGVWSSGTDPVLREESNGVQHNYNVVVVIMESMSGNYLARIGTSKLGLTPDLDSLAQHGISFDNFYSAGMHTFNGIFSVLYSYPALMARHPMEGAVIPTYTGLPAFMKERGYHTAYFTTHDDQFDNVGGFLTANNVGTIVSKKDYPADKILSTLGVPDHEMFRFSLDSLDAWAATGKPFFTAYMTASNHSPFIIPPNIPFTPRHTEVRHGCVEYADWAIGDFMAQASRHSWFSNTLFVFVADHGDTSGGRYGGFPLYYNHIPCIMYGAMLRDKATEVRTPGGQIDIFPTIAGLLGGSYSNNTMGVDLLHEQRPYMYFSQDDKVGVADTAHFYVWRKNGKDDLYNIGDPGRAIVNLSISDSMRAYAFSMLQASQFMLDHKLTGTRGQVAR